MNAAAKSRLRWLLPRISLRNLLLVTTCVALAVALWQTKKRIGPMHAEVVRLRTELGRLTIENPAKINAIQAQTGDALAWQWQIYLPPGRKYHIRGSSGYLPDQQGPTFKAWHAFTQPMRDAGTAIDEIPTLRDYWFDKIIELSAAAEVGSPDLHGEVALKARLVKEDGQWVLKLQAAGSMPIHQPNGDWLSDGRSRSGAASDIPLNEQATFPAEQRLVLMHIRRPVITESPGSWSSTGPVGDADSIVVWIESEPDGARPTDRNKK